MSHTRKCHFHRNNTISKFCTNKQCTLPLCHECEAIHLDQHSRNATSHHFIPFQNAYSQALQEIDSHITRTTEALQHAQTEIRKDRDHCLNALTAYFDKQTDQVKALFGFIADLNAKMDKIKKGSIKELIYFFSGEIELKDPKYTFQEISFKLTNFLDSSKRQTSKTERAYPTPTLPIPQQYEQRQREELQHSIRDKTEQPRTNVFTQVRLDREREAQRRQVREVSQKREVPQKREVSQKREVPQKREVSQKREVPQKREGSQKKERRSIFDLGKKAESQSAKEQWQPSYKRSTIAESEYVVAPNPPRHPQNEEDQSIPEVRRYQHRDRPSEQNPISFENRYGRPSTSVCQQELKGNQQYENYLREKQDRNFRRPSSSIAPQEDYKEYKEQRDYKPLKTTDLQFKASPSLNYAYSNDIAIGHTENKGQLYAVPELPSRETREGRETRETQARGRAFSQSTLQTNTTRTVMANYEADIRKQVLSPQEIRKMLEKRIEDRNRMLNIREGKKEIPTGGQGFVKHSEGTSRRYLEERSSNVAMEINRGKPYDTKDSIINQIYTESRY